MNIDESRYSVPWSQNWFLLNWLVCCWQYELIQLTAVMDIPLCDATANDNQYLPWTASFWTFFYRLTEETDCTQSGREPADVSTRLHWRVSSAAAGFNIKQNEPWDQWITVLALSNIRWSHKTSVCINQIFLLSIMFPLDLFVLLWYWGYWIQILLNGNCVTVEELMVILSQIISVIATD